MRPYTDGTADYSNTRGTDQADDGSIVTAPSSTSISFLYSEDNISPHTCSCFISSTSLSQASTFTSAPQFLR